MNTFPRPHILLLAALPLASPTAFAAEQTQAISRTETRAQVAAPAAYFTGNASITPQFEANAASPLTGGYVTFAPGARSAWHTHPAGQRLLVTAGVGRTQAWGGPVVEIRAGDVLWCPPGVKHWHGASPTQGMTHLALTGSIDGKNVQWMEKVTDAQYLE
jgi:quercetin dioxygenase-like cupin family protein